MGRRGLLAASSRDNALVVRDDVPCSGHGVEVVFSACLPLGACGFRGLWAAEVCSGALKVKGLEIPHRPRGASYGVLRT